MYVAPGRVEAADLEHHEIERAQALADRGVLVGEPGIAAEEYRLARRANDHRRPQRRIAIVQPTSREMLRWSRGHRQIRTRKRVGLPPFELGDPLGWHAPAFEMRADSERSDERHV